LRQLRSHLFYIHLFISLPKLTDSVIYHISGQANGTNRKILVMLVSIGPIFLIEEYALNTKKTNFYFMKGDKQTKKARLELYSKQISKFRKNLFDSSKEDCYRCVFIMQKHVNVLQYRASMFHSSSIINKKHISPKNFLFKFIHETYNSFKLT
jgi:hypothetical protein